MKYLLVFAFTICSGISAAELLEEAAEKAETNLKDIAEKHNIRGSSLVSSDTPSFLRTVSEEDKQPLRGEEYETMKQKAQPLQDIENHMQAYLDKNDAQLKDINKQWLETKHHIDDNKAQLKNADPATRKFLQDQINKDNRALLELQTKSAKLKIQRLQEISDALTMRENYQTQLYNKDKRSYYLLSKAYDITDVSNVKQVNKNYTAIQLLQEKIQQYARQLKKLGKK